MSSLEEKVFKLQSGRRDLLKDLICMFDPLVNSLARKYARRGGSFEDLRQEGYLILIKLLFRYRRGKVRLEGYLKKALDMHLKKYWLREMAWRKGVSLAEELSTGWWEKAPFGEETLPFSREEKKLLELYYLCGYNDKHISELLGKSRSWVNLKRRRLVERIKGLA